MEPAARVAPGATFLLFPDRREPVGDGSEWERLGGILQDHGGHLVGTRPFGIALAEIDAGDMLMIVKSLGWHHPVLAVFQTHGEDRWSHATVIGRTHGEEE